MSALTPNTIRLMLHNYKLLNMTKIQSEKQYKATLERIEELLPLVSDTTPVYDKNSVELELLSILTADYEDEHYPISKPSLSEMILMRMQELSINQKTLASMLNISPSRLSEYISGKSEPTLQIARKISSTLHIDADIVLGV